MNFMHPMDSLSTRVVSATINSSSRVSNRDQKWRDKYLSALNICPKESEVTPRRLGPAAPSSSKHRGRSVSCRLDVARSDLQRDRVPLISRERAEPDDASTRHRIGINANVAARESSIVPPPASGNGYGFALKPSLARGRRCHTEPFTAEDRSSAPILIPSASALNNQFDCNGPEVYRTDCMPIDRRRQASPMSARPQGAQLLSWEEPVAMLAAGDAVVNGWGVLPHDSLELTEGSNQLHHQEGDQFEDRDDHMGHDEDIFEMEGLHEEPEQQAPASRRRFRTASLNNLTSGREKRTMALQPLDGYHEMPASFVPPHQLVQRDCFSIGLRDEFKRRPTNNI